MFIHGFEGSWFNHPFWRTRFLLERPEDLAALLASDVPAVLIDVERGVGPEPSPAPRPGARAARSSPRSPSSTSRPSPRPIPPKPTASSRRRPSPDRSA
ncbi:DUF3391 domain-containing protein [Sphingomonas sp. 7/4-4]|uniref:DUF3391 domain-containing protein n=1 Tax=Sphingomonas sp. 7/4-4 TaxID=3018446 RepID=UPI003FA7B312